MRVSAVLAACMALLAAVWPCPTAAAGLAGPGGLQPPGQSSPLPFDSVRFRRLTIEEGLSQSSVYSALQDHEGYIWIGTADGLNRYDGYQFTIYKHAADDPASLSESYIWPLCEDRAGNLWVGTLNGLNGYDRERDSFERYRHEPNNTEVIFKVWYQGPWPAAENLLLEFRVAAPAVILGVHAEGYQGAGECREQVAGRVARVAIPYLDNSRVERAQHHSETADRGPGPPGEGARA